MLNTWIGPYCSDTTFICLHPHAELHLSPSGPDSKEVTKTRWGGTGWGGGGLQGDHSPGQEAVPTQTGMTAGSPYRPFSPWAWVTGFIHPTVSKAEEEQPFLASQLRTGPSISPGTPGDVMMAMWQQAERWWWPSHGGWWHGYPGQV